MELPFKESLHVVQAKFLLFKLAKKSKDRYLMYLWNQGGFDSQLLNNEAAKSTFLKCGYYYRTIQDSEVSIF